MTHISVRNAWFAAAACACVLCDCGADGRRVYRKEFMTLYSLQGLGKWRDGTGRDENQCIRFNRRTCIHTQSAIFCMVLDTYMKIWMEFDGSCP